MYLRGSCDLDGAATRKCRKGGGYIACEIDRLLSTGIAIWLTSSGVVHSFYSHLGGQAASITFGAVYGGFAALLYH